MERTSISAGLVIKGMLAQAGINLRAFPIAAQEAELPYIVYRRVAAKSNPTKGQGSADVATIEVAVWASTVMESVNIAEEVLQALDNRGYALGGFACRRCKLVDSEESWEADAYCQRLVFDMYIGQ